MTMTQESDLPEAGPGRFSITGNESKKTKMETAMKNTLKKAAIVLSFAALISTGIGGISLADNDSLTTPTRNLNNVACDKAPMTDSGTMGSN